jgi:hypothetical protein
LNVIMPDSTTTHTGLVAYPALPAPAWATSYDEIGDGVIAWSHKVGLAAAEVDIAASLMVEACLNDYIDADMQPGMKLERGTPEIQITRHDADGQADNEVPLRFEIANAQRIPATILQCCNDVEATKTATA